jgi:hypothetical protein
LPAESFDIMEQVLPSLPGQQLSPLQHELDLLSHFESLPQQLVFPAVESWLQQAQALALLSSVDGLVCVVLCAIKARAIAIVLTSTRTFDFMVSSESFAGRRSSPRVAEHEGQTSLRTPRRNSCLDSEVCLQIEDSFRKERNCRAGDRTGRASFTKNPVRGGCGAVRKFLIATGQVRRNPRRLPVQLAAVLSAIQACCVGGFF